MKKLSLIIILYTNIFFCFVQVVEPNKGRIYGLGSFQDINVEPNVPACNLFARTIAVDARITNIEDNVEAMKRSVEQNKEDNAAIKRATNALLRINGIDPDTYLPLTTPPTVRSDGSSTTATQHNPHMPINLADLPNQNLC